MDPTAAGWAGETRFVGAAVAGGTQVAGPATAAAGFLGAADSAATAGQPGSQAPSPLVQLLLCSSPPTFRCADADLFSALMW